MEALGPNGSQGTLSRGHAALGVTPGWMSKVRQSPTQDQAGLCTASDRGLYKQCEHRKGAVSFCSLRSLVKPLQTWKCLSPWFLIGLPVLCILTTLTLILYRLVNLCN